MYTRIAQLCTPDQFSGHIHSLGNELDFDSDLQTAPKSPPAQPCQLLITNLQPLLHPPHGRLGRNH